MVRLAGLEPATRGVETHCSNPTELQAHNQLAICIIQAITPNNSAFTRSAQISFTHKITALYIGSIVECAIPDTSYDVSHLQHRSLIARELRPPRICSAALPSPLVFASCRAYEKRTENARKMEKSA